MWGTHRGMSDAWSITDGFWDIGGTWHPTTEATRRALLRPWAPTIAPPRRRHRRCGSSKAALAATLADPCDLVLEDGTTLPNLHALPPDLPLGYHDLQPQTGGPATRSWSPPVAARCRARTWGWAAQLYALRSAAQLGHRRPRRPAPAGRVVAPPGRRRGDDQPAPRRRRRRSPSSRARTRRRRGCGATWPTSPSRSCPEPSAIGPELAALDEAGRALNGTDRIDRDAVHRLKVAALTRLHADFEAGHGPRRLRDLGAAGRARPSHGSPSGACWPSRYGPSWTRVAGRVPASGVAGRRRPGRRRAGGRPVPPVVPVAARTPSSAWPADGVDVVADLAVGFDPDGADAWSYQDLLGQAAASAPRRTRSTRSARTGACRRSCRGSCATARYQPFIDTIRASLAHCGGIRIDHVMGLFRLYWIPPGVGPSDGAYVRYPHHDLLDLLALEAQRAGAFVVGEDLGTVEDEVRDDLADRQILSYRLVWFEEGAPSTFPRQALAGVTTHDLPTMAGVWTGADLADRQRLGRGGDGSDDLWFRSRIHLATGLGDDASTEEIVVATHEALAGAPSLIVVATLDDAVAMVDRPEPAGHDRRVARTGASRSIARWRRSSPIPLVLAVARALDEGVRATRGFGATRPLTYLRRREGAVMIEGLPLWLAQTNCWIVAPTGPGGECVLIDVPPDPANILNRLAHHELRLVALLNTHGHVDHVGGVAPLLHDLEHGDEVPVRIHDADRHMLLDPLGTSGLLGRYLEGLDLRPPELIYGLDDGERVSGAGMTFTAIHTPGSHGGVGVLPPRRRGLGAHPVLGRSSLRRLDRAHRPARRLVRAR